ncbi:CsbD family protein [Fictibacillus iocasae]|uniref:CsbD family protein n=1 Tax=Fictibacillus iocasae TaxID=2715437 RepID=A0ABW2NW24_9BACL
MNEDRFKGNWKQLKGEAQKQWGKLTDDDYDQIQGEKEKMIGKIQERHGHTREQAEKEYDDWHRNL